jgi:nicotinate dehydrogenase subunit B
MSEFLQGDYLGEMERYELDQGPPFDFDLTRRRFFQVVGGGVVVACLLGRAEAQQPGGRGRGGRGGFGGGQVPGEIGAWLHIGEDNTVTAYTGKVEVGQNVRTSLTQAVAEELRLRPEQVKLVMADTALVPYDFGTAGSRTTPDMSVRLRRAGAAARELLLDLAADEAKVDRKTLTVKDGKISGEGVKPLTFGELTKGKKLMKVIGDNAALTPASEWKVAGTSVPKVNGRDIVTGSHKYSSDVKRPGMLFGKVLRPAAFKAELASVDTSAAEALPNVKVVRDGKFIGVVAPTEHEAERALATIKAEWKTKPQPSSDELFKYLKEHQRGGGGGGNFRRGGGGPRGSMEAGLKAAQVKVEAAYTIAYIAHAPLEPRAAVAELADGKLTVWTGTQMPFRVRGEVASALGLSQDRVRVIVPDTGSGYGGKHSGEAAVEAARLGKAAGKPVKLVWTREEEFTWAYFRPAGLIEVTAGATKDGKLTAWEFHNYNSGGSAIGTPYDVPNQRVEAHGSDSPLRQGSYRALASTANVFARESHMDDVASALKLDPLAFRLKNLPEGRLRAVLEAAAKGFGWGKSAPPKGHGYGLATGTEKGSYVAACAEVAADKASGRVRVVRVVTAFECGAVMNPDHLKNQIEGATVMGLGGALYEAIRFAGGKILNPRFSAYRVPRFADVPQMETILLDRKDLASAGAGETPIVAIAPAVGNAIFNATGIRLRSLPMVPNGLKVT